MKIAAYGTLRGGQLSAKYLTDIYGKESVKELGTEVLQGFALYHAPRFGFDCPFAVKEEGKTLTVTILDIADNGASDDIDEGESWGYSKILIDEDREIYLYLTRQRQIDRGDLTLIPSGDWLKERV